MSDYDHSVYVVNENLDRIEDVLCRIEKLLEQLIARTPIPLAAPAPSIWDCGCPPNTVCMNVACPRVLRTTCSTTR